MSLLELKRNPYLVPTVPKLQRSGAIANPKSLLVVKTRPKARVNPFRMPAGMLGKASANALGASAAFALNTACLQLIPAGWGARAPLWTRWGITVVSPFLTSRFPRLGPAFGGAMYYSILWPLYENAVKKGILESVKSAVG